MFHSKESWNPVHKLISIFTGFKKLLKKMYRKTIGLEEQSALPTTTISYKKSITSLRHNKAFLYWESLSLPALKICTTEMVSSVLLCSHSFLNDTTYDSIEVCKNFFQFCHSVVSRYQQIFRYSARRCISINSGIFHYIRGSQTPLSYNSKLPNVSVIIKFRFRSVISIRFKHWCTANKEVLLRG